MLNTPLAKAIPNRPMSMSLKSRLPRILSATLALSLAAGVSALSAAAQTSLPPNQVTNFRDTSMLKPPAGAKVAVIEWEDLECPACAHAFPFVHAAVSHYKIPLVRYDFLIPGHIWSHTAALYARWMQDKISLDVATDYRRQVFASQFRIASEDDLKQFTQQFLQSHGKQMPFVVDPTGQFEKEVQADVELGHKLGLAETPTIIVATPHHWIQVKDVSQLYAAIDQANADAAHETVTPAHRVATGQK
jgi:protein-disulfide isomerase